MTDLDNTLRALYLPIQLELSVTAMPISLAFNAVTAMLVVGALWGNIPTGWAGYTLLGQEAA